MFVFARNSLSVMEVICMKLRDLFVSKETRQLRDKTDALIKDGDRLAAYAENDIAMLKEINEHLAEKIQERTGGV